MDGVTVGRVFTFIQQAAIRGEKFDLVEIGILSLTLAGASNVYPTDLFDDFKKILNPDAYLALASYVGVVRLAFDLFPYGYSLSDSSRVFMHAKPFPWPKEQLPG